LGTAAQNLTLLVAGPDAADVAGTLAADVARAYGAPVTVEVQYVPSVRHRADAAP